MWTSMNNWWKALYVEGVEDMKYYEYWSKAMYVEDVKDVKYYE